MRQVDSDGPLLVGWAARDITPDRPVNLAGQLYARVTDQVLDPLTVTALALSDSSFSQAVILMSLDIAIIEDKLYLEARRRIKRRLPDFQSDHLVLFATHTHNSPAPLAYVTYPPQPEPVLSLADYTEQLLTAICDAAAEAWQNKQIGAVSWGYGQAVVGFNRRAVYLDQTARMYGKTDGDLFSHLEGYEDHGVDFLFTYDVSENLTGMIVNLACPSQVSESMLAVTADFWHDVRQEIRQRLGNDVPILPQCSAAGDQSPHRLYYQKAAARMLRLRNLAGPEEDTRMAERAAIGQAVADAAVAALAAAGRDIRHQVALKHTMAWIDLPARIVSEEERGMAQKLVDNNKPKLSESDADPAGYDYSHSYVLVHRFQNVIDRYERQGDQPVMPAEIQVLRIGDMVMATNRFELFLDYGLRIKARSPAVQTFVVQLAGAGSYLPTERALNHKSYGATIENSMVTPQGGQKLVDETLALINNLFD
ncbi:MAG: hypothetical protein GX112_08050 [Clostridiaceae bacterium]|jgi:hypothetical protein|nr:hypothetical protein [Clostridiaceae bacterium]